MLKVEFMTDGAAFEEMSEAEVAEMLRALADGLLFGVWHQTNRRSACTIEEGHWHGPMIDHNGNKCGTWELIS